MLTIRSGDLKERGGVDSHLLPMQHHCSFSDGASDPSGRMTLPSLSTKVILVDLGGMSRVEAALCKPHNKTGSLICVI